MNEEKLRRWVKDKLEDGSSVESVKNALESQDYDASIVDEVSEDVDDDILEAESDYTEEDVKEDLSMSGTVDDEGSKVKKVAESHSRKSSGRFSPVFKHWRMVALVLVAFLLIVGGLSFMPQAASSSGSNNANTGGDNGGNTHTGPDTQKTSKELEGGSMKDGQIPSFQGTVIYLNDGYSSPSRPSIGTDENVMFVNNVSYTVKVSFDTIDSTFTLKPGDWKKMDINSLVYYTAEPTGSRGSNIPGSVMVK